MKPLQKIAGFTSVLVVVFAAAFALGAGIGPEHDNVGTDHSTTRAAEPVVGGRVQAAGELPAGLSATEGGYTIELAQSRVAAGNQVPLQFRITDTTGAAVTRYVDSNEKQLHLIVVRRDMVGFQHVHPTLDREGVWTVPVDLSAGDYRVFADFVPAGGRPLTLGADLHVAGRYDPQPFPPAGTTAMVDGYTVTLSGNPRADESSKLSLSVSRDGTAIIDLQPYLGAYGHLVALRASDLAYLHVHPAGEPGDGATAAGPQIDFHTTIPSSGDYRLFLDFKHRDVVRTAEFTVSVAAGQQSQQPAVPSAERAPDGDGHGH